MRLFSYVAGFLALGLSTSVAAQSAPDVGQMFANFSEASVALINLVRWLALPVGLYISYLGIIRLKEMTESNGRIKAQTPIFLMLIGAFLLAFPWAANLTTETLMLGANSGTTLSRMPSTGGPPGIDEALKGVLLFIKMVGHIAFFRGFLVLKDMAEGQSQQATMGKALTHILGGAAAINIDATIILMANTFAPGMNLSWVGG